MFPLVEQLPSTPSVEDCSPLFGRFAGTTCSSDSPPACALVVWLFAFSSRSDVFLSDTDGVSRFSRMEFPDMPGVSDCAGFMTDLRLSSFIMWPSASQNSVGTPNEIDFAAQYPACLCPCRTLRLPPYGDLRMTRGQDGSLLLSCRTLSFPIPCRFIPALTLRLSAANAFEFSPATTLRTITADERR